VIGLSKKFADLSSKVKGLLLLLSSHLDDLNPQDLFLFALLFSGER
jgi:hypothetical protein